MRQMWQFVTGSLAVSGNWQIIALCTFAAVLATGGIWLIVKCRQTPVQRERTRTAVVHRVGRMGDATITDVREHLLHYSYQVRGVAYTASQDVSALLHKLPEDLAQLIGHCGLKYSPRNPANSIVVSEEWSGMRSMQVQLVETHAKETFTP
ncbi:MAG: hypothetical protein ABIZ80_25730 [Bryobacteraceae bacterium]